MTDTQEQIFHFRFLGEQVLHSSYCSASFGWLSHKLASFSISDNVVHVKLEDDVMVLRKLDTSSIITKLPLTSNCQCFIHNRKLVLFTVVGGDVDNPKLNRLLVFRASSVDIIKDFSSLLRKGVLALAFRRTNPTNSLKITTHMSNFFEVFYMGRARFSSKTVSLTPEFVDKAVSKLGSQIDSVRDITFFKADSAQIKASPKKTAESHRQRSNTVGPCASEMKELISSKSLGPPNPNRTLLFQLTEDEVFLISPTSKTVLLRISFAEVAAGCQGLETPQCFALLTNASDPLCTTEINKKSSLSRLDEVQQQQSAAEGMRIGTDSFVNKDRKESKNKADQESFSPSQHATVNSMWAYVFLCADENASSNAVLSLRTCIRGAAAESIGKGPGAYCNNGSGIEKHDENILGRENYRDRVGSDAKRDDKTAANFVCDDCPIQKFNTICSSLIDLSSDEERLDMLNDVINLRKSSPLCPDDATFVRQLLPKSAQTSHALICDIVFALFQLAESKRASHVHTFESAHGKAMKNKQPSTEFGNSFKLGKSLLPSASFNGPLSSTVDNKLSSTASSLVDVLREKISLKSMRRGSDGNTQVPPIKHSLVVTTSNAAPTNSDIDLRQLIRKPEMNNSNCNTDVFRDYVIVSNAEVRRMSAKTDQTKSNSDQSAQLQETPKSTGRRPSLKGLVPPGSEPTDVQKNRRNTVDYGRLLEPTQAQKGICGLLGTSNGQFARTPLARYEQYPNTAPDIVGYRRHCRLASVANIVATPMSLKSDAPPNIRRRSIFEMVVCPVSGTCSNITTVTNSIMSSSKRPSLQIPSQPTVSQSAPTVEFTSVVDYEEMAKQLDYEEPLNNCPDSLGDDWLKLLKCSPESVKDESCIEKLLAFGVPKHLRGKVWAWLVERELILFKRKDVVPVISATDYANLLSNLTPCNQQILMDLGRTFPNNVYFAQHFGAGQLALFNILKAYSLVDPEVGYCQGISFVAGVLLMHSASEYDAFCLLLSLMYGFGLRTVYLPNMEGLHRCLYQLTRLLDSFLPAVFEHLTTNDVMPIFFASPWIVTLFASQFPLGFVVRVFDLIFYGNLEMLFRIIFSLFSINEPLLLSRSGGFEDIVDFLKTTFTEMSVIQMERIVIKVFSLDFDMHLHRYAVEYDIYREEHDVSPARIIEKVVRSKSSSSYGEADERDAANVDDRDSESQAPNASGDSRDRAGSVGSSATETDRLYRDLAVTKHKVVELRAQRAELLQRVDDMSTKLHEQESEIIRLESVNEMLRAENAVFHVEKEASRSGSRSRNSST